MIVVVGGTGGLGRRVVHDLLSRGEGVRVVARRAPEVDVSPAEFVAADVRSPQTLVPAFADADVVVSAITGMNPAAGESLEDVDRDGNGNLIAAARAAGAQIVLVSVVDARPDHPMELFRMKAAAEQRLRSGPVDWTLVRASAFAEAWAQVVRSTTNAKGVPKVFGRGENPLNLVAMDDVVAAVTRAATDPSLRGEVIEVGGENLTMTQFARLVTGHSKVAHIPRGALRVGGLVLTPFRPAQARLMRSALVMDTADLRFDPGPSHAKHPWLPSTPITAAAAAKT